MRQYGYLVVIPDAQVSAFVVIFIGCYDAEYFPSDDIFIAYPFSYFGYGKEFYHVFTFAVLDPLTRSNKSA